MPSLVAPSGQPKSGLPKEFGKSFVHVPAGVVNIDEAHLAVGSFFISRTEVSNAEYRKFLNALKAKGDTETYRKALWDSSGWSNKLAFKEPYVQYYHSHPAYNSYPAVNIPPEGAHLYCVWLTEELRKVMGNSSTNLQVRLPTKAEWIRAAEGTKPGSTYSWGSNSLRNPKCNTMCNYLQFGEECIRINPETNKPEVVYPCLGDPLGVAGHLSDHADLTAPVMSYSPSSLGIYNMNGNVAELVEDGGVAMGGSWLSAGYDVRNRSEQVVSGPAKEIGFRPVIAQVVYR